MSFLTHTDVIEKIITELKMMHGDFGILREEIHYKDFPFIDPPKPGIVVSPLEETEGNSTNETSDIGYPVQLVRAYTRTHGTDMKYGLEKRANWRQAVFNRFNHVRLNFPGVCTLPTRARFGNYQGKEPWDNINIDSSTVILTVWVRQRHQG